MRSGLRNPAATQIAFFGGSFTAIDRTYMLLLLQEARNLVGQYGLAGIRISTRPDRVDEEVLALLKSYGVTAIELGAQSMNGEVLLANHRGHTPEDVRSAAERIRGYGFELGLQMMTGLYKDTSERAVKTMEALIACHPDTMRIYPAVVLPQTELAELFGKGLYRPQKLEEAVELSVRLIQMCEQAGVRVIRVGLHAQDGVDAGRVAGPYHPAFRELCESRVLLGAFLPALAQQLEKSGEIAYNIKVSPRRLSAAVGQRKANINRLAELGYQVKIVSDASLNGRAFTIESNERKGRTYAAEVIDTAGL